VIQWYPTGGANQAWQIGGSDNGNPELPQGYIANVNSGMCLATDGTAGDQLFQERARRTWSGSRRGTSPRTRLV
jgi:hypothetical protein